VPIEGAGHGFKGADLERADAKLFEWFDKYLKPAGQVHILVSDHGHARRDRGDGVALRPGAVDRSERSRARCPAAPERPCSLYDGGQNIK